MIRPASEHFYFQVGKFGYKGLCRSSRHGQSCSVVDPPDQPLPQRRPRHAIILNTCDVNLLFCLTHLFLSKTHRTTPGMFIEAINLNQLFILLSILNRKNCNVVSLICCKQKLEHRKHIKLFLNACISTISRYSLTL